MGKTDVAIQCRWRGASASVDPERAFRALLRLAIARLSALPWARALATRALIPLLIVAPAVTDAAEPYAEAKSMIGRQCAACHTVPGVPGARGNVGPSLKGIARRRIIAGKLANNPANMVHWLMHPQQVVPGNAMPELGLTEDQARKIAAYLYTLDQP
jgi:cytochrome c2